VTRETNVRSALRTLLPAVLAAGPVLCGCGEEHEGITFREDVQPLLASRCVPCHHAGNQTGIVDMGEPFLQDDSPGLVGSLNVWEEGHPGNSAKYNVTPFEATPEASFILEKITNRSLLPDACDPNAADCRLTVAGQFMPPQQFRLSSEQVAAIKQWILDGAEDTPFYQGNVAPLFGNPFDARRPGVCSYCHYPGSPDRPDFTKVFDPIEGIVGVKAQYRKDLELVVPFHPESSFLVMKLEAQAPTSAIGAPMPRQLEPFSEAEVATIRQWIAEGARND
jgi:hypothetical protein